MVEEPAGSRPPAPDDGAGTAHVASAGRRGGAPIPAAVSIGLAGVLVLGALAAALALPPRASASGARPVTSLASMGLDPLTGRRLDAEGRPVSPASGWGSADQPIRLRFVPSGDRAEAGPTVEHLLRFLEQRTGYHVEGAVLRSYGLVIEEILAGRSEVAFLTAASYARAWYASRGRTANMDTIEPILQVVRRGDPAFPGSDLAYRGALIVRTDSPIRSLADLQDGTTVAMGPRVSGASSLLPSALFGALGLHPKVLRYEGAYPMIVNAVLQGAADVGCVWWSPPNPELPHNDARVTVRENHPDVFERTRIIGYTSWLPNEPIVVRSALSADVKQALARALSLYVSTRTLTTEGRDELVGVGSPVALIPATEDDFRPLFEVIEHAFANDPEGRRDFMASER